MPVQHQIILIYEPLHTSPSSVHFDFDETLESYFVDLNSHNFKKVHCPGVESYSVTKGRQFFRCSGYCARNAGCRGFQYDAKLDYCEYVMTEETFPDVCGQSDVYAYQKVCGIIVFICGMPRLSVAIRYFHPCAKLFLRSLSCHVHVYL